MVFIDFEKIEHFSSALGTRPHPRTPSAATPYKPTFGEPRIPPRNKISAGANVTIDL